MPDDTASGPALLCSARQLHRRAQRRITREELARRSVELDRAVAGLPRRPSQPRCIVRPGDEPRTSRRASRDGLGEVGLQEVAALERAERGRQYVATVSNRQLQATHAQDFRLQVALERAAAESRARIETLQFELLKRKQWDRDWIRCSVRLSQIGRGHARPELTLEFPVRLRHGTTVSELIVAASSGDLVSYAERDYLHRTTGITFETGPASCCAAPLPFGAPRYALQQVRPDGSIRPLAERDAAGNEWCLDQHGIRDGALLLLEPL